jgi:hypothetical protein
MDIMKIWDDLALAKALEEASEHKDPDKCGKLVDLFFSELLRFKFSFSVDFSMAEKDSTQGIEVTISTGLRVMLGRTGEQLDEIKFPQMQARLIFEVPNAEALFNWLLYFAKKLLKHAAEYLLDHPDQMIKLIAWMNAKEFGKGLVKTLICRRINPDNVVTRHKYFFPELYPEPPQPPTPSPLPELEPLTWWQRALIRIGQSYATSGKYRR